MDHHKSLLDIADNIEGQANRLREVSRRFAQDAEQNAQTVISETAEDLEEKAIVLRQLAEEVSIGLIHRSSDAH